MERPEYEKVQAALGKLKAITDVPEAHGTLCGLLLGQQPISRWLEFTLESVPDKQDLVAREQLAVLDQLYQSTKVDMNGDDMALELMLPEEDHDFSERLLGLASWCQGFLYGLGVNGEGVLQQLSDQGRECMDDLMEISQLSHDEEQNAETENVFAEVVEHVRMSVIYMNDEINPLVSPSTVH